MARKRNLGAAYDKGFVAFAQGKPYSNNPYKRPKDHHAWSTGWVSAQGMSKDKFTRSRRLLQTVAKRGRLAA